MHNAPARTPIPILALALAVALGAPPLAAAMGKGGHGAASAAAGAARPAGTVIREAQVGGYRVAYRLYTWEERNALMKDMMGMTMAGMNEKGTHHLMSFFTGADGRPVAGGKVGFLVTAPDGSEQKTLTMGMYDGYGADLVLRATGAYRIRIKADFGGKAVGEEFVHEVR